MQTVIFVNPSFEKFGFLLELSGGFKVHTATHDLVKAKIEKGQVFIQCSDETYDKIAPLIASVPRAPKRLDLAGKKILVALLNGEGETLTINWLQVVAGR